jgi:antitoxin VapB
MGLHIKNREVERLAAEVARMTGESKTEAVRRALAERKERLARGAKSGSRAARMLRVLEEEIWPQIPAVMLGREMTKQERETILGYGPDGV